MEDQRGPTCKSGSKWWRNIIQLDGMGLELCTNWLKENILRKVGKGSAVQFWTDWWVGESTLAERLLRHFNLAADKNSSVSGIGLLNEGEWGWRWSWHRPLFQWEIGLVAELDVLLLGVEEGGVKSVFYQVRI